MRMAKASEADLDMAMDLSNALDELTRHHGATVPEAVEKVRGEYEQEWFDPDNAEQCQRVLGHLLEIADRASLMRVVWGMATLIDPANQIVDPDLGHLELHPKHRRAAWLDPRTSVPKLSTSDPAQSLPVLVLADTGSGSNWQPVIAVYRQGLNVGRWWLVEFAGAAPRVKNVRLDVVAWKPYELPAENFWLKPAEPVATEGAHA